MPEKPEANSVWPWSSHNHPVGKQTGPCQEIIGRISGILDKNLTSVKVRLALADELRWTAEARK
jgi:hypothetical protein